MEKTLGLTTGQAYWYIRRFLKANIIEKLDCVKVYNNDVVHPQSLYRYIGT